ncbi:MAG: alpha/beta hydrolase [Gammaproteobacteria bacterium]|nr:alpha/beta hydrolase [Pseudomonadales bacterium]
MKALSQKLLVALILVFADSTVALAELPVEHLYFTTSDGLKLHYAKLGETGSTVFLIHGSGGMAKTWLENGVAQTLAEDHVVIAPDMRGHGMSEGPRDGDMALDVIELMDHLGVERAHIHGFSMGGSITSRLMARIPERIITAAFGGSGVRETEKWAQALVPPEAEGEDPQYDDVMAFYRSRLSDARSVFEEQEAARTRFLEENGPIERDGPPARELDLTTIEFPVLAIVGELDGYYERTHRLYRELNNFQAIKLPMTGHLTSYYPGFITDRYLMGLVNFININDE